MFKTDINQLLNMDVSEKQMQQFELYYQYLIEYNKITNLTRITEKDEVYYKHFYDSLTLAKTIDLSKINSLCDMGAGAGFPSIPIKILFPHLKVTIIDSLGKRITFLKKLIEILEITNIELVYDRIENHAHKSLDSYDLVTARALGKLPLILELGLPMVKIGGIFVAFKSNHYEEELSQSKKAIDILGGKLLKTFPISLPYDYGDRVHIIIEKVHKSTNKYPRPFSTIKKKSL